MRIPESTIDKIRDAASIVDVVGNHIRLRKKGKSYWAPCPFHSEKTPSFHVQEEKQLFYCFGCHTGGDVFKFLMEYKKISYVESVQEIAQIYGIPIEYDQSGRTEEVNERELLYDLNESVAALFTDQLLNSSAAKPAMTYLTERGLTPATIRSFQLGYSPSNRTFLVDRFAGNEGKTELALELGLIGKSEQGKLFDRFAGRIIFPIFSTNGRVVAFAGRVFQKDVQGAKYVNSPESKIYTKGKILYGLSHGKEAIRKEGGAIMVEGYMDLISLHQNGVKNVLAVSGTALTEDQALLLSRYTKDVVLLFDADEAGLKASLRSVEILLKKDINIRIASLPNGEDPDSYIRKNAVSDFKNKIDTAPSFLEFQTGYYHRQGALSDPMKSAQVIRELLTPLALIDDLIKRQMLLKSLGDRFGLRERLLDDELQKIMRSKRPEPPPRKESQQQATPSRPAVQAPGRAQFESEMIKILFEGDKDITDFIRTNISDEEIFDPMNKEISDIIFEAHAKGEALNANHVLARLTDESLHQYAVQLIIDTHTVGEEKWNEKSPLPETGDRLLMWAYDVIRRIKLADIDTQIRDLKQEAKTAETPEHEMELLQHVSSLQKQKREIVTRFTLQLNHQKQAE